MAEAYYWTGPITYSICNLLFPGVSRLIIEISRPLKWTLHPKYGDSMLNCMKDNPVSTTKGFLTTYIDWEKQYDIGNEMCVPLLEAIRDTYQNDNDPINSCHVL